MKLSKRLLFILCIILFLVILLSAFGYVNSQVSYKYEVQDSLFQGPNPEKNLDAHQKEIIGWIKESKIEFVVSAILLIAILTMRITKPKFNGRLQYV